MWKKLLPGALALTLALSACSSPAPEVSETPEPTPTPVAAPAPTPAAAVTPSPTPSVQPFDGTLNPLTGLPLEHGSAQDRPVAIMLNNIKNALPMQGQGQADILYEIPVEGGITRLLGLYQDPTGVPAVGSIRSARTYYLELALGHDALYFHIGGSPDAYDKIGKWNVTSVDGITGTYSTLMWRDEGRRKSLGAVHSVITTGEVIADKLPNYGLRLEHEKGYVYDAAFAPDAAGTSAGDGQAAGTVTVPFSGGKNTVFQYDEGSGKYLVSEYGKAFIDNNTKEQVAVTNLIVLKTACKMISGDDKGRLTVDLSSGGEGWFACGGKYIPITWSKDFPNGQLRYAAQDGQDLVLQAGNSYVCIAPTSSNVTFA